MKLYVVIQNFEIHGTTILQGAVFAVEHPEFLTVPESCKDENDWVYFYEEIIGIMKG